MFQDHHTRYLFSVVKVDKSHLFVYHWYDGNIKHFTHFIRNIHGPLLMFNINSII